MVDRYKLKFTRLQNEIFRLLCVKIGVGMNQREIAESLGVSPPAVAKSVVLLKRDGWINIEKSGRMNLMSIELNRDSEKVVGMKRVENLKMIYESGIVSFLEERFPGSVIILFGSYAFGEDNMESDIDIAVVGCKSKVVDLGKYDKFFEREVRVNFYDSFGDIHKNLRSNICSGVVLVGRISL